MARVHPWAPCELAVFDKNFTFRIDPPGGLTKPDNFAALADDDPVKAQFALANAERMRELVEQHGQDAVFIFTDGARQEQQGRHNPERCAGAFVICAGAVPNRQTIIHKAGVAASPIACVYSAELGSIDAALRYVLQHPDRVFGAHGAHDRSRQ